MDKYIKKVRKNTACESSAEEALNEHSSSEHSSNDSEKERSTSSKKRKYLQKTRNGWLADPRLKMWLVKGDNYLSCKYCLCKLRPKLDGLIAHSKTAKHNKAIAPFSSGTVSSLPLIKSTSNKNMKIAELKNALYAACHTSIRAVDHLTIMQKGVFSDSKLSDELRLGRTKCSGIIKNILSQFFKKQLQLDIGLSSYSLIIDESTDVSIKKYLGIVIRYYSENSMEIINTFLKLVELENSSADGIVSAIFKTLKEFGLEIKNCKGLGTDNASVMVGVNRGVIAILQKHNPNIILVPCICHSIQLAVSSASKSLPSEIEFLVSETFNWFSKSASRQSSYSKLFSAINDGHEPLKIVRACDTRWLSIETAVKRICDQWLELKTHFEIACLKESCHKAMLLSKLYVDTNQAYLQFLKPVLNEVQIINKMFESNTADPTKLFAEVNTLLSYLCNIITYSCEEFDPLSSNIEPFLISLPHFSYNFEEFIKSKINQSIDIDAEKEIRETCRNFVTTLIKQLRQRLPKNIKTLKNIDFFSVQNSLKRVKSHIYSHIDKEKYNYSDEEITNIELQWQKLSSFKWIRLNSTLEFWKEVRQFKNACNDNPFIDLVNLVFNFLVLPFSNAEVERIFSAMNVVKTKQRNKIKLHFLNALLMTRCSLKRLKKCCHDFEISEDLLKFFEKRMTVYEKYDSSDEEDNFEDIMLDL